MMRNFGAVQEKLSSTAVLPFVLMLALFGNGCGDFFVSGNSLNSISLTPTSLFLAVGETKQVTANGTTVNGNSQDVTGTASWTSTSAGVASVNAGLVTAVASGTTTITASQDGVSANAGVIVNTSALQSINVTSTTTTIVSVGSTLQLKATATFADNTQKDITNQVAWTSGSTTTATVTSAGVVTGVQTGTVTITAAVTTASGTQQGTISIQVQ